MSFNIIIVEDEIDIANLIELYLLNDGYTVQKFASALPALEYSKNNSVDLAILDVMLPDLDGFALCAKLRQHCLFPIIMLTARISERDKIAGLTVGADDYITKPFSPLELMARVKAHLRRVKKYNNPENSNEQCICIRGLSVDKESHICTLNGEILKLTPIEFSIVAFLAENCGKAISSERLFEQVWGEQFFNSNNTVMVHIRRLRAKMNEPQREPNYIKTVWGVGYKIEK